MMITLTIKTKNTSMMSNYMILILQHKLKQQDLDVQHVHLIDYCLCSTIYLLKDILRQSTVMKLQW
jgi:hypothetical protein